MEQAVQEHRHRLYCLSPTRCGLQLEGVRVQAGVEWSGANGSNVSCCLVDAVDDSWPRCIKLSSQVLQPSCFWRRVLPYNHKHIVDNESNNNNYNYTVDIKHNINLKHNCSNYKYIDLHQHNHCYVNQHDTNHQHNHTSDDTNQHQH